MVYDQIASTFGLLVEVDWQHSFQNFYETVRLKVACKDPNKIPTERVFGMQGRLYRLFIEVEPIPDPAENGDGEDPPPPADGINGDAEMAQGQISEDGRSKRSSRTGSEQGSGNFSSSTTRQLAINYLQQVPECDLGENASPIYLNGSPGNNQ